MDLNCYRLWGHNELDDPSFTNPALYSLIKRKQWVWIHVSCDLKIGKKFSSCHIVCIFRRVPEMYADKLKKEQIINEDKCNDIIENHKKWLNQHLLDVEKFIPQVTDVRFILILFHCENC